VGEPSGSRRGAGGPGCYGHHALRLNPRYIGAYANRGLAWLRQGKLVEAEQDFERCLTLNKELKPLLEQRVKEVKEGRAVKQ
jgi:Tfp pilus assembly protein PilF